MTTVIRTQTLPNLSSIFGRELSDLSVDPEPKQCVSAGSDPDRTDGSDGDRSRGNGDYGQGLR